MFLQRFDQVTLEHCEHRLAKYLGTKRENSAKKGGYDNQKYHVEGRESKGANIWGLGGELAFAKLANIYPRSLKDKLEPGSFDLRLPTGERVDVKSTLYVDDPLLVVPPTVERGRADVYVSMLCDYPTYWFFGWAPEDRVLAAWEDIGYGDCHVLHPHELECYLFVAGGWRR